jgi:multiple sugar transport system permease protein
MKNRKFRSPLRAKGYVTALMMAPFSLVFLIFVIIPIIAAVTLSFSDFNMIRFPQFVGLKNYAYMFFSDDVFLIALKNTVIFALLTGPLGFVLSFTVAWIINEFSVRTRTFFTLVFYLPSLAGNVFFVWMYLFTGDSHGFINSTLMRIGILKEPIVWLSDARYSFWVVVIVILWMSMGTGFLAIVAALQSLNKELEEAGAIDGIRNRFQQLRYIVLPQMAPALTFAAVISVATSFTVGYQGMQLTGFPSTDYSTHTLVLHIMDYGFIRYEMGYASSLAVVLFFILLVVWKYLRLLINTISSEN